MRPPVAAALVTALATGPALSGWLAYRFAVAELDRAMALRPPVAVIDYQPITARLAQGVAAKDLESGFATLKSHSTRLGEHGYLVLNRASLDAVPERYLVPAQLDLPAPPPARPATPTTNSPPATTPPVSGETTALDRNEAASLIRSLTSPPARAAEP